MTGPAIRVQPTPALLYIVGPRDGSHTVHYVTAVPSLGDYYLCGCVAGQHGQVCWAQKQIAEQRRADSLAGMTWGEVTL